MTTPDDKEGVLDAEAMVPNQQKKPSRRQSTFCSSEL